MVSQKCVLALCRQILSNYLRLRIWYREGSSWGRTGSFGIGRWTHFRLNQEPPLDDSGGGAPPPPPPPPLSSQSRPEHSHSPESKSQCSSGQSHSVWSHRRSQHGSPGVPPTKAERKITLGGSNTYQVRIMYVQGEHSGCSLGLVYILKGWVSVYVPYTKMQLLLCCQKNLVNDLNGHHVFFNPIPLLLSLCAQNIFCSSPYLVLFRLPFCPLLCGHHLSFHSSSRYHLKEISPVLSNAVRKNTQYLTRTPMFGIHKASNPLHLSNVLFSVAYNLSIV